MARKDFIVLALATLTNKSTICDAKEKRAIGTTDPLTLSYKGFLRLVLHGGGGGGGHKVPADFFSETVKATAIKPGILTN